MSTSATCCQYNCYIIMIYLVGQSYYAFPEEGRA